MKIRKTMTTLKLLEAFLIAMHDICSTLITITNLLTVPHFRLFLFGAHRIANGARLRTNLPTFLIGNLYFSIDRDL